METVPLCWVNNEETSCVWPNNSSNTIKLRLNKAKLNVFDFTTNDYRILSTNIGK